MGTTPDAYNWLAYAMRRNGDPSGSIPIYQKALALDPKHRGAHEYIGEAYLTLDNLPKAKEHLGRLDKLCFFPCSQYRDLKKAVEAYESSGGGQAHRVPVSAAPRPDRSRPRGLGESEASADSARGRAHRAARRW